MLQRFLRLFLTHIHMNLSLFYPLNWFASYPFDFLLYFLDPLLYIHHFSTIIELSFYQCGLIHQILLHIVLHFLQAVACLTHFVEHLFLKFLNHFLSLFNCDLIAKSFLNINPQITEISFIGFSLQYCFHFAYLFSNQF